MNETTAPAIEDVLSEVVISLAFAAHTYLEPAGDGAQPDLAAAEIAIDTAAAALERIAPRLDEARRTALSGVVAEVRMGYVRKRGL
jgi:hypothetical protein